MCLHVVILIYIEFATVIESALSIFYPYLWVEVYCLFFSLGHESVVFGYFLLYLFILLL